MLSKVNFENRNWKTKPKLEMKSDMKGKKKKNRKHTEICENRKIENKRKPKIGNQKLKAKNWKSEN